MLAKLQRVLAWIESGLLVSLLLVMIVTAVYQVVARNVFGGGLVWGDPMVRVAMLWITLVGATVAVGSRSHIRIDLVARFAGDGVRNVIDRITALFAGALCAVLGWTSLTFIEWERADQTLAFGIVPAWICAGIIPVAAGVMALRFFVQSVAPQRTTRSRGTS